MDDTAGPLQIAFYDLMGQAVGLPMARMFGPMSAERPNRILVAVFPAGGVAGGGKDCARRRFPSA